MPEIRPPRLRANTARCRALVRWFSESTTADVQSQIATAPHWPLIDGSKPPTARRYRMSSPGPTTAA
jgi:hypothetical protein